MTRIRPMLPFPAHCNRIKEVGKPRRSWGCLLIRQSTFLFTPALFWLGRGLVDDAGVDRSTNREGNPCFK